MKATVKKLIGLVKKESACRGIKILDWQDSDKGTSAVFASESDAYSVYAAMRKELGQDAWRVSIECETKLEIYA